jgi:hypothetical protein
MSADIVKDEELCSQFSSFYAFCKILIRKPMASI